MDVNSPDEHNKSHPYNQITRRRRGQRSGRCEGDERGGQYARSPASNATLGL